MFFKGSGGSCWGPRAFALPCDRVESINPQNANFALVPKHIKCNLFKGNSPISRPNKTPTTQSCCWGRGGSPPPVSNARSLRIQGSPGVHHATYVMQSYSVFCVESQDRYYKAGIRLRVNRWRRVVQRVNFWPQFFLLFCSYLALISPSPVRYPPAPAHHSIPFETKKLILTMSTFHAITMIIVKKIYKQQRCHHKI